MQEHYLLLNSELSVAALHVLIKKYRVIFLEEDDSDKVRYAVMLGEYRQPPPAEPDLSKWTDTPASEMEILDDPVPLEGNKLCFPFKPGIEPAILTRLKLFFETITFETHNGIHGGIYQAPPEPPLGTPPRILDTEFHIIKEQK